MCTNCRRRKIKCDKGEPCSNCVTSNASSPCEYDKSSFKAENPYTLELQLSYQSQGSKQSEEVKGPPHGYLGQFSLNSNALIDKPRPKKRAKTNLQSGVTYVNQDTEKAELSVSGQQKTEIQILKERLEQIERSLLRSDMDSKRSELTLVSTTTPINTSSADSKRPSASVLTPNIPGSVVKDPINGLNGSHGKHALFGTSFQDQSFSPILPPLSASFTHEVDRVTPIFPVRYEAENTSLPTTVNYDGSKSLLDARPFNQVLLANPTRFDSKKKDFLLIGQNLVGNTSDTMNFYEHYSSIHQKDDIRRVNFGPFAWSSLMRRDQGLHLVWEHVKLKKENSIALVFANSTAEVTQENANTLLNSGKDTDQSENQFQKRALETDGIDEIIPYSSILKARKDRNVQKQNPTLNTLLLGLTYYDVQIDRQLDTIEKIRTVLPHKSIIWKLVRRFFDAVYVYMPYLDEGYFREDVSRIIGPESHDATPVSELRIERKLDLAVVGILLTVLRLAYLSLLSNNTSLTEGIINSKSSSIKIQESKYLLTNPISIDTVNVASLCFDQFQFMRRANFTVLQLALYLKMYHTYAPEDGDGADGGGSQALGAVLLQMSYQLGLNREPDETCVNLRMNNLSRKIWYFVCLCDIHLASCFGNPLSIDDNFHDTKFPYSIPGGENLKEKSKDKTIVDRYIGCGTMFFGMKDLLRETLNVKNRVSLTRITSMLTSWEVKWYQHSGSLSDCFEFTGQGDTSVVDRNFKIKTYVSSRCFLMTMYFHIYLYYEPHNIDVSFFYYKKCLLILTADVMPHYSTLLRNSEVISDMIINPTLEMFIHKSNMVYLSGITRVNFLIYHMRQSRNHGRLCGSDLDYMAYFKKLCRLSSCLTRAAEYTISAINKISHRYYYAWRITKSQTVLLRNTTSTEFYESNYERAYPLYRLRYSASQVEELIFICENTLASFHNSEFSTFGFSQKADTQLAMPSNGLALSSSLTPPEDVTDLETDKLWLQILSWKHDVLGDPQQDTQCPFTETRTGHSRPMKFGLGVDDENSLGVLDYIGEHPPTTKLDIFSDLPFNDEGYS